MGVIPPAAGPSESDGPEWSLTIERGRRGPGSAKALGGVCPEPLPRAFCSVAPATRGLDRGLRHQMSAWLPRRDSNLQPSCQQRCRQGQMCARAAVQRMLTEALTFGFISLTSPHASGSRTRAAAALGGLRTALSPSHLFMVGAHAVCGVGPWWRSGGSRGPPPPAHGGGGPQSGRALLLPDRCDDFSCGSWRPSWAIQCSTTSLSRESAFGLG